MEPVRCVCCSKELKNSTDTFGEASLPMCWECWSTLEWEDGVVTVPRCTGWIVEPSSWCKSSAYVIVEASMDQAIDEAAERLLPGEKPK